MRRGKHWEKWKTDGVSIFINSTTWWKSGRPLPPINDSDPDPMAPATQVLVIGWARSIVIQT
jgi:hypothetical protein